MKARKGTPFMYGTTPISFIHDESGYLLFCDRYGDSFVVVPSEAHHLTRLKEATPAHLEGILRHNRKIQIDLGLADLKMKKLKKLLVKT